MPRYSLFRPVDESVNLRRKIFGELSLVLSKKGLGEE
jgi:hypothetical protein